MELRQVMSQEVAKLMEEDPSIAVINADLATAHDNLWVQKKFPDRAFNIGCCEQNLVGVAAGMSAYGMTPFVYSFASFASRRACDQIALSVMHPKLNVKIVGSDPGIAATILGATHSSFDDIGSLRSIPGLVIYEAVDSIQLKQAIPQIVAYKGGVYIRLIRRPAPDIFDENYKFDLFKADIIREGTDVTIFATGILVMEAVEAVKILEKFGISVELINVHTIKPLDKETILNSLKKTKCAVVCENHNVHGGLFSAISELTTEHFPVKMKGIGAKDRFSEVGDINYLRELFGFTPENIAKTVQSLYQEK